MDQKHWPVAMKRHREALTVMEVQTVFAIALGILCKVHGYQDNGKHDSLPYVLNLLSRII